jgi:enoyl-[acyl-carrier protein] reductase I
MGILAGKRALIVGVATDRSIAWGIAQAMHEQGAELAFSYANDRFRQRVEPLANTLGSRLLMPLDVTLDEQIEAAFALLKREWGPIDIVVHAVAFAPREALDGSFTANTSREAFRIAHDVSSYSFTALARAAAPLMQARNGALLTLTYLGAVRSLPSYNVMGLAKASLEANVRYLAADLGPQGVRVNGISAGPIKTLAAAGIGGFRRILAHVAQAAPLRRNVTTADVGNAAAFLCSDMAAGITGEIVYVDAGYSSVGMSFGVVAPEAGAIETPSDSA